MILPEEYCPLASQLFISFPIPSRRLNTAVIIKHASFQLVCLEVDEWNKVRFAALFGEGAEFVCVVIRILNFSLEVRVLFKNAGFPRFFNTHLFAL